MGFQECLYIFAAFCFLVASNFYASGQDFGYQNNYLGPGQWGCLSTNFSQCRIGTQQSPINIKSIDAIDDCALGNLSFHFSRSIGRLISKRYVYEVKLDESPPVDNTAFINGIPFKLAQFHFHSPSEHFIDGERFAIEMHLVFQALDNASTLAVVAQMFQRGDRNPLLSQVLGMRNNVSSELHLDKLKLGEEYFRYYGSLTTPPCTEGVTWTVLMDHKSASQEQIYNLQQRLQGRNARPLQRLNGREVFMYTYYQNFLSAL